MRQKKHNKQKDILFVLISSFVVVVAWIAFNIYHIWATSTVSEDIQLQLTPISPNFDPQTIQQLKLRENINPLFDLQPPVASTPTPSITPSPGTDTTASPSAPITEANSRFAPTNTPINIQGQ